MTLASSSDPASWFFSSSRRPYSDAAKSAWFYNLTEPGCGVR
jgi:hypothetical protein